MTELRLAGVSKRYGDTETSTTAGESEAEAIALQNVDLTVNDGEFFTLVGPSGCGKTTTLRTIAGFEEPTTGTVTFDGDPMTGVPPEDRDVGVVFQSYALFPHLSVAENVSYGLKFRAPPAGLTVDERVRELLELVDLEGMGERDPAQLSGGQQQRVALARALAPAPELLLLDEPMSALDARLRESLRRQLSRIQSELDITTVYVTHDQAEALAISDRLAVMHDGEIEQIGRPKDVYREPDSRFVAEFVGDNNVFDGRVVDHDGERATVAVGETQTRVTLAGVPTDATHIAACVRPGALRRETTQNQLTVDIETTEFLGERVRVHGHWNSVPIVLRLAEPPSGETCSVGFEPEAAHVISSSET
ncbi:ABC transporter [Natrialba chahannaoensis JCM 10990]|uniref:Molybdate/tungstate import ATP-binding protein WtpC n=1 Tax=Natrialba chahannaoensis JCM 10990 TaxID=1227492 RepID=M0AIC0_9EURY|nr:ABC transporter ATP-binding protein [Natrialba chahannaoensis]ELY98319.1 ABC transporter [Natrialba chahannaoensis JCM 10990]